MCVRDMVCPQECRHLRRPEEGIRTPGVGVTGSCELSNLSAGNQTWVLPLQEQNELLIASLAVIHDLGHTAYRVRNVGHVRSETVELQADDVQTASGSGCSLCAYSYREHGGRHQRTVRVLVIIALLIERSSGTDSPCSAEETEVLNLWQFNL